MKVKLLIPMLLPTLLAACVTLGGGSEGVEKHRVGVKNIQSDGWSLMQSTEGGFSAKIPGNLIFSDFTVREEGTVSHTLMTSYDKSGMYFEASLYQGATSGPVKKFEEMYSDPSTSKRQFLGYPGIWDKRFNGRGGIDESVWFKTPMGVYMLTSLIPVGQDEASEKFYASFSLNQDALSDPNLVPAHALVKLVGGSIFGSISGETKLQAMTFSGAINDARKPKVVREIVQMLATLPKNGREWGLIIEDQRVASEIFMEALRSSNSEMLRGLRLVFVGKESDREATLALAKAKGIDLSYIVRAYV